MAAVILKGADQLRADLKRAGVELADLSAAHARVAGLIASAAKPPRRTGRLAASIRPMPGPGAVVGSDLPYARYIEHRSHYLATAVESTQPQWLEVYEAEIQGICDRVGAA